MKNVSMWILKVVAFACLVTGHLDAAEATTTPCIREATTCARTARRLQDSEKVLSRMEDNYASRQDQADYRLSLMAAQVADARAQADAAKNMSWGVGVSCFFSNGNCIGSSIRSITYRIARANARVASMEARYNAYVNSLSRQLARLEDRVNYRRAEVAAREADSRAAESALNACLTAAR